MSEGANFRVVRIASQGELGEDLLAVTGHFEGAAGTFYQRNLGVRVLLQDQVPRTAGTRQVVSSDAILNFNFHRDGPIRLPEIYRKSYWISSRSISRFSRSSARSRMLRGQARFIRSKPLPPGPKV